MITAHAFTPDAFAGDGGIREELAAGVKRRWTGLAARLDSERTAPVKANQRLTVANPRPRRHWAAKVISATGKPGRGRKGTPNVKWIY
jgi:hypothetical protein